MPAMTCPVSGFDLPRRRFPLPGRVSGLILSLSWLNVADRPASAHSYGEIIPRSVLGRLLTVPLLVFGLLLIALPSFVLGRNFAIVFDAMQNQAMRKVRRLSAPLTASRADCPARRRLQIQSPGASPRESMDGYGPSGRSTPLPQPMSMRDYVSGAGGGDCARPRPWTCISTPGRRRPRARTTACQRSSRRVRRLRRARAVAGAQTSRERRTRICPIPNWRGISR